MKFLTSKEIRNIWISFFKERGHYLINSASLLPLNDKSLLFINAGITPLKKYFDGTLVPPEKRLISIQKCLRTNDIDNVGKTSRHHTFFEMMGNFSIGGYKRDEAISFGFDLLTNPNYFDIPVSKLYITYYYKDFDTKNKWASLGISERHLIPLKTNFWEIGDGPCGPDTEIFFDRGESYDKRGIELLQNDIENDRYIEIWNIVFSEYNAITGVDRDSYPELPHKNIDTGAGLERFACIFQDTKTNFETDLFSGIIKEIEILSRTPYENQMAFKVISDHIRCLVMALGDGAILSNVGRGYVLKRILRRALKFGRQIGLTQPFLHLLVDKVSLEMSDFYPNVKDTTIIKKLILAEEEKFISTLSRGESLIKELLEINDIISGKDAFILYDTFGFPIELTVEYAEEDKKSVDLKGFYEELEIQKQRSKEVVDNKDSFSTQDSTYLDFVSISRFVGYDTLTTNSKVIQVFDEGIVLDITPFYATSGGQLHDTGYLFYNHQTYHILDVIKLPNGQFLHKIDGKIPLYAEVEAVVDSTNRAATSANHSSLHLLQKALRLMLGAHITQQGSYVDGNYARFDFNHFAKITSDDILQIEAIVKASINDKLDVNVSLKSIGEATKEGAIALFTEKYGDKVRVVNMSGFSIELCGGTHVTNTSQLGDFSISDCYTIGSGIYRIEVLTGNCAEKMLTSHKKLLQEYNNLGEKLIKLNHKYVFSPYKFIGSYADVVNLNDKIEELKNKIKIEEKKLNLIQSKDVTHNLDKYSFNSSKKQVIVVHDIDASVVKELLDALFDHIKATTLFLINVADNKLSFLCKSTDSLARLTMLKAIEITGSGGGNEKFSSGQSREIEKLDLLVKHLEAFLKL